MFKFIVKIFFRYLYKVKPPEMVQYGKEGDGFAKTRIRIGKDGTRSMEIQGEKYMFPGFPRQHVLIGGSLMKFKKSMKHKVFHAMFNIVAKDFPGDDLSPFLQDIKRVFDMVGHAEITGDMKSEMKNLFLAYGYYIHKGKDILSAREMMKNLKPSIDDARFDILPIEQCCSFVKELWSAMTALEEAEEDKEIKEFVKTLKIAFCFFMQEDDAWRFRWQWVFERLNRRIYKKYNVEDLKDKKNIEVRLQFIFSHMNYNKSKLSKVDMYFFRGKWFRPEKFTKWGWPKYDY